LKREEIAVFAAELSGRFPDRMSEALDKATRLEREVAQLQAEAGRLRTERETLDQRVRAQDIALGRLLQVVLGSPAGKPGGTPGAPTPKPTPVPGTVGGSIVEPSAFPEGTPLPDPAALEPLIRAVGLLLRFAEDQESTAATVEDTLGVRKAGGGDAAGPLPLSLPEILARLGRGEPNAERDLVEVERRLRRLRLLPGALLAGAQQSWKGGTREVLEHLDPKAAEESVQSKMPGLREAAVVKEVRRRFDEFWGQFEKNIAHYYRGKLERIYTEKMEDRP
jgi:hypothetical protein